MREVSRDYSTGTKGANQGRIEKQPHHDDESMRLFEEFYLAADDVLSRDLIICIRVVPDLFGCCVEEQARRQKSKTSHTKRSFHSSLDGAAVQAGRIAHYWIQHGYRLSPRLRTQN